MELHHRVTLDLSPRLELFLREFIHQQHQIMANLAALTDAVTTNTVAIDAAIAKLQTPVPDTDQTAIDQLTATLVAKTGELAAATNPPTP